MDMILTQHHYNKSKEFMCKIGFFDRKKLNKNHLKNKEQTKDMSFLPQTSEFGSDNDYETFQESQTRDPHSMSLNPDQIKKEPTSRPSFPQQFQQNIDNDSIPIMTSSQIMCKPISSSASNYDELIEELRRYQNSSKIIVLLFSLPTCAPCKNLKKFIYDEQKKTGYCQKLESVVQFIYVNLEVSRDCVEKFNIMSVPHAIFASITEEGVVPLGTSLGGKPENLDKNLRQCLNTYRPQTL